MQLNLTENFEFGRIKESARFGRSQVIASFIEAREDVPSLFPRISAANSAKSNSFESFSSYIVN